jgi:hypothetical protein
MGKPPGLPDPASTLTAGMVQVALAGSMCMAALAEPGKASAGSPWPVLTAFVALMALAWLAEPADTFTVGPWAVTIALGTGRMSNRCGSPSEVIVSEHGKEGAAGAFLTGIAA